MISLGVSVVINVGKYLGLEKVWSVISYYHVREVFEQFERTHCVKVFPAQEALDNQVYQMHQIRQKRFGTVYEYNYY